MHDTAHYEVKLTFDAVYYYVADMERSVAFYQDFLGLRLTSRDYLARFDIDGVLFEFVPNAAATRCRELATPALAPA
jgi:catechol 2,3-dioxygenase-like lactoylglutathione lyase family enzyme